VCQNLVNSQLVIEIQLLNLEFVFMPGGFFLKKKLKLSLYDLWQSHISHHPQEGISQIWLHTKFKNSDIFLLPTGTYCLKHMVISKMFFLEKSGNFGAFFSHKNPFLKSVATFSRILFTKNLSFRMSCTGFFLLIFLLTTKNPFLWVALDFFSWFFFWPNGGNHHANDCNSYHC
jgi:hypothetical protein